MRRDEIFMTLQSVVYRENEQAALCLVLTIKIVYIWILCCKAFSVINELKDVMDRRHKKIIERPR